MSRDVREEELVKQVLATDLKEWRNPRMLGHGEFGVTYRVQHVDGKPFAVLKVFRPTAAVLSSFGDAETKKRFSNEIQALRKVDHPRIPTLKQHNLGSNPPWFLMQFVPGPTIADIINNDEPLPEDRWFATAKDLLEALEAAHAGQLIHRDLNPGNVVIAPQGASLIDFGIAALVQDSYSPYQSRVGAHLEYRSPEQLQLVPITGKSDVFSLASLLTFAGTGHHPWTPDDKHIGARLLHDKPNYAGLSSSQQRLLEPMHAKSPKERLHSGEALALLNSIYQPAKVGARRSSTASRPLLAPASKSASPGPVVQKLEQVAQRLEAKEKELKANRVKLRPMSYVRMIVGFFAGSGVLIAPFVLGYWAWKSRPSRVMKRLFLASIATFIAIGVITGSTPTGQEAPASATVLLIVSAVLGLVAGAVRSMHVEKLPLEFIWRGSRALRDVPRVKKHNTSAHGGVHSVPEQRQAAPDAFITDFDPERGLGIALKTWDAVRAVVKGNLEERAGKQFLFEMDTRDIEGIFFQGYPEENGAITIEAAADLSVRPSLTTQQFQGMLKLGWEPPSDGLPNFIQFLELNQSSIDAVADLIIRTMQEGYGVTLDSLVQA